MAARYLHGSVLALGETPQRRQEVDVAALDELPLRLPHLLLDVPAADQGGP